MREIKHFLGLDLAGAKNNKTSVAAIEYYPREKKSFLLEIYEKIDTHRLPESPSKNARIHSSQDAALVALLQSLTQNSPLETFTLGANVPLQLPPGLISTLQSELSQGQTSSRSPSLLMSSSLRWMEKKTQLWSKKWNDPKILEFTPYTQRAVELWIRYEVLPLLPTSHRFEIDEALGGNKAPLTARMAYLIPLLPKIKQIEVWPKLSTAILSQNGKLPRRVIQSYRKLEEGIHSREVILEHLTQTSGLFIYERDIRKLTQHLSSFDAFICAFTALLEDLGETEPRPKGFPTHSNWVGFPRLRASRQVDSE